MAMFKEFKDFIERGNVMDLAVGVIMGGAFGTIVTSLTSDIIMPIISALGSGVDLTSKFILIRAPQGYSGAMTDYQALKDAGAVMIGYGAFITAVINFLLLSFVVFMLVRYTNRLLHLKKEKGGPSEVDLLKEIRDELRAQGSTKTP